MSTTTETKTRPVLIGGERRQAASGETIESTNPATGERLGTFPRCGAADVDAAVTAGQEAFREWSRRDPLDRAAHVVRLADAIDRRAQELAELDVADNGSPLHEMRKDMVVAAMQLRWFAGLALQVRGDTVPAGHDRLNYSIRQPYGVVARIVPFNHPLLFTARSLAAPLVAGNAVVIKPSEYTSLSSLALIDDLVDIFPPGVVSILTGYGREVGDALSAHPDIRRLSFTGSPATGLAIMARAAAVGVKHITLELGGKNPIVVFPDADLDLAVDGVVRGMNFTWQGQSCGSTSRVLVDRSISTEFLDRLAARIGALRPGMPMDSSTDTGAIVNQSQLEKVLRYVELGREDGATLLVGGERVTDGDLANGLFVRPAVLSDVRPDSRLAQEEIFGPVLAAIPYSGYDEALQIANDIRYGLTASVFTRNLGTAHAFARDVEAGYVWVNESSRHTPGAAFGGWKDSGLGREEDLSELESFTQQKNVHVRFD
jgi:acyl-CoA reductase-like NAD-dependent aldehyde dehydrogenase